MERGGNDLFFSLCFPAETDKSPFEAFHLRWTVYNNSNWWDNIATVVVTRSYLEKIRRALYLLNPVKELLERCSESSIVLDALSDVMLHYDDAECDGHCLLEDINAVLEEKE